MSDGATAAVWDRPGMIRGLMVWWLGGGPVDRLGGPAGWAAAALLLVGRAWLAWPFFSTGWLRVTSWSNQPFLFEYIHPVPYLPPQLAAGITTAGELTLPVLLAVGLFGRPAAFGLAVMAATIYFIVGATPAGIENGIANAGEQVPWMAAGLALALAGPGPLSLDWVLRHRLGLR